jgi:hypothetical protein
MARASTGRSQANPQAYPNGRPIGNARRSGSNTGGSEKLFAPGGVKLGNTTNKGLAANTGTPTGSNGPKPGAGAPGKVVSGSKRMRGGRGR